MELDVNMRDEFREKVRFETKSLIDLNQIDDLEDFDSGLYISNVFERNLKEDFDLDNKTESEKNSLRSFLWSACYNQLEVEQYEDYIKNSLKK